MDWLTFVIQWTHVLLGVLWFGNSLVLAVITIPAINRLPIPVQRQFGREYGARATPVFDIIVPLLILLGMMRGTLLGPIDSLDDVVGTAYGITWLVGLLAAVATFLWGRFVIVGAVERMAAAPLTAEERPTPELEAAVARVKRVTVLELIGFLVVFTCMILMRFGR
jgi:putative copper export protein